MRKLINKKSNLSGFSLILLRLKEPIEKSKSFHRTYLSGNRYIGYWLKSMGGRFSH